ncbi:MAG: MATE family efflux transporter [Candidatus Merdivicinus sp.]|jgi:putative MATE family efflux protein
MKKMFKDKDFLRLLAVIALPIAAQNLITFAIQMMDTIMLGAVGQTQLTAASLANQPFFVFTILTFGLASGASVLNAQYWGKGQVEPIRLVTALVLKVAFAFSVVLSVLILLFPEQVMRIYTPEEAVIREGVKYLRIIVFTYVIYGVTATYISTLRSIASIRIAVVVYLTSLCVNVFLNWVLIFGNLGAPAMGIEGAALATLIARLTEFVITVIYAFFIDKKLKLRPRHFLKNDWALTRDYFRHGLPVVFNELLWSVGVSVQSMILGRLGEAVVSASQIASVVQQFATVFVFGIANAAAVIIGNAVGEGNLEKAGQRAEWLKAVSLAVGVFSAGMILLIRPVAVSFYNVPDTTKELAGGMVAIQAVIVFFVSITAVGIVGILRGGGDTRFALCTDLCTLWLVALPAGLLTAFVFRLPVLLVYAAIKLDEPVKVAVIFWRLRNRNWIKNVTRSQETKPSRILEEEFS